MSRKILRQLGDCGVQKPKSASRYEQPTILNATEKPTRILSEKFNGLAELETNSVRVGSMEGVGIEV